MFLNLSLLNRLLFLDGQGKVLNNAKVKVTVDGKTYTKTTNAKGVVSLDINLKPGTYKVSSFNPVTGYNLTTTFKILTTIKSANINKIYTDKRRILVLVLIRLFLIILMV